MNVEQILEAVNRIADEPIDHERRWMADGLRNLLRGSHETYEQQAPIAKITVRESGAGHYAPDDVTVSLYAPGLPPGEHDVYCEPGDPQDKEQIRHLERRIRELTEQMNCMRLDAHALKASQGQYCVVHNTGECPFCKPFAPGSGECLAALAAHSDAAVEMAHKATLQSAARGRRIAELENDLASRAKQGEQQ